MRRRGGDVGGGGGGGGGGDGATRCMTDASGAPALIIAVSRPMTRQLNVRTVLYLL